MTNTETHTNPGQANEVPGDFFTNMTIGLSDGLIVPFAIAAGLSRVVHSNSTIIIAGVATTATGAILLALGRYFTGRKKIGHHHSPVSEKQAAIDLSSGIEKQRAFLSNLGLSSEMQEAAINEMKKDEKQWADQLAQQELEHSNADSGKPAQAALNTGLSYIIGGLLAITPFFFTKTPADGLKISAMLTLFSLFILGFVKGRVLAVNAWWMAARMMLTGAIAGGAAYAVAKFFHQA